MSPAEKKLVRKMDAAILSFGAIAFFLKYLDRWVSARSQ
jgi:hypothetical protein